VVQTMAIKANEELSIQYTTSGEYWQHRDDYPWQLHTLACERYGLPLPVPPEPPPKPALTKSHSLVTPPKQSTDNLLEHRYYYCWPVDTSVCSMRISTLNVNGALHDMTGDTAAMVAHILDAAQISILGMTDARTPADRVDRMKQQFHHSLPYGTAVIAFPTSRPCTLSGRNMTMGGQVFIIDRQWEQWIGSHRSDPSGLALVTSIRVTYNQSSLSIIQVMVPPKSRGPYTMWTRLLEYLKTTQSPLSPAEYVMQTAEKWAVSDRLAGRGVVIMGDFNKPLSRLHDWATTTNFESLGDELLHAKTGSTFASFNGTSTTKPSLIDHIFVQSHSPFQLTSIGGTMHPQISDVTDHNVIWAGVQWPESPSPLRKHSLSTRITNNPDLPSDKATIQKFKDNLDSRIENERILHPDIDQMSPNQAGRIQARLVQLSVEQAKLLSPKRVIRRVGKGSPFKNGYSPQFMVLKASLHAHVDIRRLLWKHTRERSDKDAELDYILRQWRTKRLRNEVMGTPHPQSHLFPRGRTVKDFLQQNITKKIADLRSHMHGRQRQQFRVAMSDRMRDLETMLASRKLGRLIRSLLPKSSEPLNFNMLLGSDGAHFRTDCNITWAQPARGGTRTNLYSSHFGTSDVPLIPSQSGYNDLHGPDWELQKWIWNGS
jgi:hypothetical protein